jgi:uncharacterized lipoprotein YddW (UPF0748 family)
MHFSRFGRFRSYWAGFYALFFLLWAGAIQAQPAPSSPELRAFWVDAFHGGIRTPQEAEQLVADAKRAGINTLIVQVRRRGDALYTKSFEPPLDDPAYDPQFDALANTIEVAHRAGIEVHAWINAMPVWRDDTPPRDARHVFNRHGPGSPGDGDWFTRGREGVVKFPVGFFLDPGHPAAAEYLVNVYLNVVRNYAVDGIHFDYIRYPETTERLPRGADVGYNATSLARFRRVHSLPDDAAAPTPDDAAWIAWRRQQVTQLVRRVYIEAKATNPKIKVSAALIPWGKPPTKRSEFEDASPMQRIFQNWQAWLEEGILDLAIPMNYAREHDATVRGWFDGWIRFEKRIKHNRQLAVGIGAYVNRPENTLAQIARARKKDGRRAADGVSFFSYANLFPAEARPEAKSDEKVKSGAGFPENAPAAQSSITGDARVAFFSEGVPPAPGEFAQPAPIPKMPWIESPQRGMLAGIASDAAGNPLDGARIRIRQRGLFVRARHTITDGNGWFGAVELKPGRYTVRLEGNSAKKSEQQVEISAGRVTRVELRKQ